MFCFVVSDHNFFVKTSCYWVQYFWKYCT